MFNDDDRKLTTPNYNNINSFFHSSTKYHHWPIIDTVLTMKNGVVDKSNRPIIENMFSIRRVL
jgi:hypothetical protein